MSFLASLFWMQLFWIPSRTFFQLAKKLAEQEEIGNPCGTLFQSSYDCDQSDVKGCLIGGYARAYVFEENNTGNTR